MEDQIILVDLSNTEFRSIGLTLNHGFDIKNHGGDKYTIITSKNSILALREALNSWYQEVVQQKEIN